MEQAIISTVLDLIATVAVTLIGVAGAWLLRKMERAEHLKSIALAVEQVIQAARQTVSELEQTLVKTYKAAGTGKLSADQIAVLQSQLLNKTAEKLSQPVRELLEAAQTDVGALITGAGEQWLHQMKG
jgi:hypothetical protein